MYPVDFRERLKKAQTDSYKRHVNCISAAFYLLGLRETERCIDPKKSNSTIVSSLEIVERTTTKPLLVPNEATLVGVWSKTQERYWHLGVISPFDRTEVIDRRGSSFPIRVVTYAEIYNENFGDRKHEPYFDFLKVNPRMYL